MGDQPGIIARASEHASDRWLVAWALGYAAVGASTILLPLYALTLGGGPLVVGALEATAALAGVPGALLWGRLADRTGHRRVFILVSLAGTGIVLAVVSRLDALVPLVLANAVLWFMVSAATPVVTLFVIEAVPEREWDVRIGLLNAYQRYGWVGGLLAGTLWLGVVGRLTSTTVAQRSFFVLCAGASLAAIPLIFYWLPPEVRVSPARLASAPEAVADLVAGSGRLVKLIPYAPARALAAIGRRGHPARPDGLSPTLRRYLLVTFVFSAGFAVFFGPAPAFLDALGYGSSSIFALFIVATLASAVVFVPVGTLSGSIPPKTLQLRALGARSLLFPAFGLVGLIAHPTARTVALGLGFAAVGITWAVVAVTGASIVSRSASKPQRGRALGVYAAVAGLGGGVGGLLGGAVASVLGYRLAFALAGALVLTSLALLVGTRFTLAEAAPEGSVGRQG